jgi:hypothetical protein
MRVHWRLTRACFTVIAVFSVTVTTVTAAFAASPQLKGSIHDPQGDATTIPSQGTPDTKRVWVDYDPVQGVFEMRVALYEPVPSFYLVKSMNVTEACSPSSPVVMNYDAAAVFNLHIAGIGFPENVVREEVRSGARLTVTWAGPELRGLSLGCVRDGVIGTGVVNLAADRFESFELH